MGKKYSITGEKLPTNMSRELENLRINGVHGTRGILVYADEGAYFVQTYHNGKIIRRRDMNESLLGALEEKTKEIVSKDSSSRNGFFGVSVTLGD